MKTIKNLTAEQLRKSILQLAIQGKLVKQDPNDEPASELVKRIHEEKRRLIQEGKIKRDKNDSYIFFNSDDNRYYEKVGKEIRDITEQLPFDIPDNWAWVRLSSLCDVYTGDSISETDKERIYRRVKDGLDYIGTKDVNFDHSIVYDNGVKIPRGSSGFKRCPESKVLLCIEGGSAGRKIGIAEKEVCFGNKLACFNSWLTNDKFLFLFLQSPQFLQFFKNSLAGIIRGVSINNLKRMLMPLPPLKEQERIVEKYWFLEKRIADYGRIEENLSVLETNFEKLFRASILRYAIEGKLVKQDPNDEPASVLLERIKAEKERLVREGKIKPDRREAALASADDKGCYEKVGKEIRDITEQLPFDIPDNWAWVRLSSLCDVYTGDSISETDKERIYRRVKDGLDYIGTKDVNFDHSIVYDNGVKIPRGSSGFKRCPESKVLLCIEGGSAGRKIGIAEKEVCFGNKLACFNSWLTNDKFLFLFLQSPQFLQFFKNSLAGIIRGVSINNLKRMLMPLPPLKEQERIVEKYSKMSCILFGQFL